tara:strand:+ start:317 stop:622 length:306 start_codon:yes stop_codon:yes gene_type:complete
MEIQIERFDNEGNWAKVSFWCDYTPARSGRTGHIDDWSEDTYEEFEFSNIKYTNGVTDPEVWLDVAPDMEKDLEEDMTDAVLRYIEYAKVDIILENSDEYI